MNLERRIVRTYRRSYDLSTRPDDQNTLSTAPLHVGNINRGRCFLYQQRGCFRMLIQNKGINIKPNSTKMIITSCTYTGMGGLGL